MPLDYVSAGGGGGGGSIFGEVFTDQLSPSGATAGITFTGSYIKLPGLTQAERNTMQSGLTSTDGGVVWYNTSDFQYEGWNGSIVVVLG